MFQNPKLLIPERTNLILGVLFVFINILYFYGAPTLVNNSHWWWLILLPAILTTNSQWALTHEAVHGIFHRKKQINAWFGRFIAFGLGLEFNVSKFGHLMHHRFNRLKGDLTEGYDPNKNKKKWKINLLYYFKIFIGVYLSGVLSSFLFLLPKKIILLFLENVFKDTSDYFNELQAILLKDKTLRKIRVNAFFLGLIWSTSFFLYGHFWWVLLSASLLRGFMLSFADNLPHYGTPIDDTYFAYNLTLPNCLQKWILNFNLHRIHHHHPLIPWKSLPEKFLEKQDHFDMNYFMQGMRQLRGVIPLSELSQIGMRSQKECSKNVGQTR